MATQAKWKWEFTPPGGNGLMSPSLARGNNPYSLGTNLWKPIQ